MDYFVCEGNFADVNISTQTQNNYVLTNYRPVWGIMVCGPEWLLLNIEVLRKFYCKISEPYEAFELPRNNSDLNMAVHTSAFTVIFVMLSTMHYAVTILLNSTKISNNFLPDYFFLLFKRNIKKSEEYTITNFLIKSNVSIIESGLHAWLAASYLD